MVVEECEVEESKVVKGRVEGGYYIAVTGSFWLATGREGPTAQCSERWDELAPQKTGQKILCDFSCDWV